MATIGIIRSGQVGRNLVKAAVAHGCDVVLSNSQGAGSLSLAVDQARRRIRPAAA
jgi:predicted dinucleotide-binding enzyme